MGLRGPAKKPSALEAAQGNPGKRATNSSEPKPPEGVPEMPAGLTAEAKRVWQKTVEDMMTVPGLLTIADGPVLFDFCQVVAEKSELEDAIRALQSAAVKKESRKREDRRRASSIVKAEVYAKSAKLLNLLRNRENVLRRELGLSPSARSSIRITSAPEKKTDALDSALFGRPRLVAV